MGFCTETIDIWHTVGMFMLVFKIVIPLLIIILGMVDLGKAVVSSDDKAVSKATKSLLMRVIAGVCIFFIPTIVGFVLKLVSGFGEVKDEYKVCADCIASPTSKCSK